MPSNHRSTPGALAPEGFFKVHQGDSRKMDVLLNKALEQPLLTATITSPPYWDLKDYGHEDQIGWGQALDEYLEEMRLIFRAVHRHTRDDGSLWIVADSLRPSDPDGGVRRLEPLPFQLADEAREAGWSLRDIIIWKKDKTLPWSSPGRLRNIFEYVLLLVKSDQFKYRVDRIRDPIRLKQWWVKWPERHHPEGKVPVNVWDIPIPVQGSWKADELEHMCPLPPDLVERLVLLSTDPGDVVFDPFAGTGVVIAEAERLGRHGVGIELVDRYVNAYEKKTLPVIMKRDSTDTLRRREERSSWLKRTILKLRVTKYPKVLYQQLEAKQPKLKRPHIALVLMQPLKSDTLDTPHKLIDAQVIFMSNEDVDGRDELRRHLKEIAQKKPASKFGIAGDIDVVSPDDFRRLIAHKMYNVYPSGQTWKSQGRIGETKMVALLEAPQKGRWPTILSNVYVNEEPRELDENSIEQNGPDAKASPTTRS